MTYNQIIAAIPRERKRTILRCGTDIECQSNFSEICEKKRSIKETYDAFIFDTTCLEDRAK